MTRPFKLSPTYTNLLDDPDDVRRWVGETAKLPVAQKIDAMRSTFFTGDFEKNWSIDPETDEFRDLILTTYEDLTGRPYSLDFEPVARGSRNVRNPFPYNSKSNRQIGENLLGVSVVVSALPLPLGARILEMGCGWANTSLTLARSGFEVTCVDIDPSCEEIIDHWAPRLDVSERIRFVESGFEDVAGSRAADRRYDAVVFFKSFHHCLYPQRLLTACRDLLKPGGVLLLAAEPIVGNYYTPWGLRRDGTSLFAIVSHGWMELGFDTTYLDALAGRKGFTLRTRKRSSESPTMNFDLFERVADL